MSSTRSTRLVMIVALLGFGVGGALLAGCYSGEGSSIKAMSASGSAAAAAQPHAEQVGIDNFTFSPATVTIAVGTKVTWVNHDDVPHTVTANDKRFSSKALDTDAIERVPPDLVKCLRLVKTAADAVPELVDFINHCAKELHALDHTRAREPRLRELE